MSLSLNINFFASFNRRFRVYMSLEAWSSIMSICVSAPWAMDTAKAESTTEALTLVFQQQRID